MVDNFNLFKAFLTESANTKCADCCSVHVKFASLTYGSVLCSRCATIHLKLGGDVRPITEEKCDRRFWSEENIEKLLSKEGNESINKRLESELPHYYRRPWPSENCPSFLCEVFIRAKYIHEEFTKGAIARNAQGQYASIEKSGYLWKKLRDSETFCERFFDLSVERNYLRYFVKATDAEAKETLDLEKLNITFIDPMEFGVPPHTVLIQFVQDASTRHIFVRSEEAREIINWYNTIRMGKYNRICINYACMGLAYEPAAVAAQLTRDLDVAGWLNKTGPKKKDAWRKRWCMLFQRHLLYADKPLSAFAKGELFIGSHNDGFYVKEDTPDDWKKHNGYAFTIYTKVRPFVFVCDTKEEQLKWMSAIEILTRTPLTLDESKRAALVVQKC